MMGPGKYDDLCTLVREKAQAQGVILIVFQGDKGSGLSCQLPLDPEGSIPAILRSIAQMIEDDYRQAQGN